MDVRLYEPSLEGQVTKLIECLWGSDGERNTAYFRWKYGRNPHAELPLGIVALSDGKVVGFRGFFAARFTVGERDERVTVLRPGDTCVHPDFRRQGLSVEMGRLAVNEFSGKSPLFLNLSCTKNSLPGYLKMGFVPIASKRHLIRASIPLTARYLATSRVQRPLDTSRVRIGSFKGVDVSDRPRPDLMAELASRRGQSLVRLSLHQDEAFFRWRYENPRASYMFYYGSLSAQTDSYIVVGLSSNSRRAFLLDFGGTSDAALEHGLTALVGLNHFDVLSVHDYAVQEPLSETFDRLGFKRRHLLRDVERVVMGELPLLLRPIAEQPSPRDFFIQGMDSRCVENWDLKPVCSDAA